MSRRFEFSDVSESLPTEDEFAVFDPAGEWFVPGVKPLRGEAPEADDDEPGLRAILERPEALAKAWLASARE
jgi:hypothetical protein